MMLIAEQGNFLFKNFKCTCIHEMFQIIAIIKPGWKWYCRIREHAKFS